MRSKASNHRSTSSTRSDLASSHNVFEYMMHLSMIDVSAKLPSHKKLLSKSSLIIANQSAQSFMEHLLAAHSAISDTEYIALTIIEIASDSTKHKSGPPLCSAVKLSSDIRG